MKQHKVGIIIFFLCLSLGANAQINHFIYLQTENKQPFYVKLDKIVMSSSAAGYLIIPKLKDGNYTITVGFPKNEWKEQAFDCTVQQQDAGYILKNFGEKGWGLFNLQSLDITMSASNKAAVTTTNEGKTDAFSALLSNVVNEPSLAKKEIVKKDIVKTDSSSVSNTSSQVTIAEAEQPVENKPASSIKKVVETTTEGELHLVYIDNTNNKKDSIDIVIAADNPLIAKQIAKPINSIDVKDVVAITDNTTPSNSNSAATQTIEQATTTQQVPAQEQKITAKEPTPNTNNKEAEQPTTTQQVQAPDQKVAAKESTPSTDNKEAEQQTTTQQVQAQEQKVAAKESTPNTDNAEVEQKPKKSAKTKAEKPAKLKGEKFLPMELAVVTSTTDTVATTLTINPVAPVSTQDTVALKQTTGIINSDCISNATDEDFLKLRKKMAAASTDDDMMEIAKKVLKQKCFSTGQIKNLAVLFLNDSGRYSFFDLAYPFVWDSYNYGSLQNQLTDPYFNNRFKAMIR